jgi:hypothetical protein
MNDFDHHTGMATYALLSDIENWLDLSRERSARKLLTKDIPDISDAIEKLLKQTQAMLNEAYERTAT